MFIDTFKSFSLTFYFYITAHMDTEGGPPRKTEWKYPARFPKPLPFLNLRFSSPFLWPGQKFYQFISMP